MHVESGGYLADPEGKLGKLWNPTAETLESLAERPCLALLGEPGIGKTSTVRDYLDVARAQLRPDEDLLSRNLAFGHELERGVASTPEFRRWLDGETTLHLFLDSLDEYLDGGAEQVAKWLLRYLERGPIARLRLRLTCRTAAWPPALDAHLASFWKGKDCAGFYELAPLRRRDVELAAGTDAQSFLRDVEQSQAVALAVKPITLGFLLAEYQRHHRLPSRRWDLYERGCRILCDEQSETRPQGARKLDADQCLAVAARIAAVTMLGHRSMIWRGPDRGDIPPEAVLERELYGGAEQAQTGEIGVGAREVAEVFTISGLFTARGDRGLGWMHQTYAEFLAAWFLENRGLSATEMLREVTNADTPGKVVPALHETAAWLAGMNSEFFQLLVHSDPEVLLRSDFAKVGEAQREALVSALLGMLAEKQILDDRLFDPRAARSLDHPRLAGQLRPYILDKNTYFMARRAAIDIAEACRVDALLRVTLDAREDPHIRSQAAHAIVAIGDRATKQRLRPLVFGQCGPDLDDNLKGYAMQALWHDDLTANDLFANLDAPQRRGTVGIYQHFAEHYLMKQLRIADMPRALIWASTLPAYHDDKSIPTFQGLMAEILERAWEQLHEDAVLAAFAMAARSRLACHESIFGGHRQGESLDAAKLADEVRRRRLLMALVDLTPPLRLEATTLVYHGSLVCRHDVPWIITHMKSSVVPDVRTRWAQILAKLLLHHWTLDVIEPIVTAWEEVWELSMALQSFLGDGSVEIDSPTAAALREAEREATEQAEKFRRILSRQRKASEEIPPAAEHISSCLDRFEAGDSRAGWELHGWMTIDPEGKAHASEYETDLIQLPGWKSADETTKKRIIEAGRAYLLKESDESERWLLDNMIYWPAVAGCRYLHLLAQLEPSWVGALPPDVWRRWAAILVEFHENGDETPRRKLVAIAYRVASDVVLNTLRVLLLREWETTEHSRVLGRMAGCWDERFGRFMFDFTRGVESNVLYWRERLGDLLEHKVDGAREYAATFLTSPVASEGQPRERALAAAHTLIVYARDAGWPAVWPLVRDDPAFGREVFLDVVFWLPILGNKSWGHALSEDETAELYLWLEQQFPVREDPKSQRPGRLSGVTARQRVGELRNAVVTNIISRGTREGVAVIERLSKAVPYIDWTVALVRVKQGMVQGTWKPRRPAEILALRPRPSALFAPSHGAAALPGRLVSSTSEHDSSASADRKEHMPLLNEDEIRDVHAAAVRAGLVNHREALLATIDRAVVASLPHAASPGAQLMRDLAELSDLGVPRGGGAVPLRIWLANAAHLVAPRAEEAVFARYRDLVAVRPLQQAWPPPPTLAPRIAMPMTTPTTTHPVDLGIIVALEEEISELLDLASAHISHDGGGMNSFLFERGKYRCAVTLVGKMGETEAATMTERHIACFDPVSVVSIGISGGVHEDLRVGDVFVPTQTVQYMQDGKTVQKKRGGYVTVPGSPAREVDHQLLTAATGFRLRHKETHTRWQKDTSTNLTALVPKTDRDKLFTRDLVRRKAVVRVDGHAATGPVVAGSTEFSDWIRSHDRNVKAVDMESAAVVRVAQARNDLRRALVIRGISDYGDPRKKKLDAIGNGGLRKYAMRNAVRFLFALMDEGALPFRPR